MSYCQEENEARAVYERVLNGWETPVCTNMIGSGLGTPRVGVVESRWVELSVMMGGDRSLVRSDAEVADPMALRRPAGWLGLTRLITDDCEGSVSGQATCHQG